MVLNLSKKFVTKRNLMTLAIQGLGKDSDDVVALLIIMVM